MRASLFIGYQNPDRIGEFVLWIERLCEKIKMPLAIDKHIDLSADILFFLDGSVHYSYLQLLDNFPGKLVFIPSEWATPQGRISRPSLISYNSFTLMDKIYDAIIRLTCNNNSLFCYNITIFRAFFFFLGFLLRGISYRFQLSARSELLSKLSKRNNLCLLFPDHSLRRAYCQDCAFPNPSVVVHPIINQQDISKLLRSFLDSNNIKFFTTGRMTSFRRRIIKYSPFPISHISNSADSEGFFVNVYIPQSSSWYMPSVMRSYRAINNHTIPFDYGTILPDCFDFLKPPISLLFMGCDSVISRFSWTCYVARLSKNYYTILNHQISIFSSILGTPHADN
jgi:hypothetical protein